MDLLVALAVWRQVLDFEEDEARQRLRERRAQKGSLLALDIDDEDAIAWNNLGCEGGGTVAGIPYTVQECYQRALDVDDEDGVTTRCCSRFQFALVRCSLCCIPMWLQW